ncbi:hypothetical protein J6590_088649 [Homalodisca vitripennis]|nr:hypothetical protein J6590_088649 [Homalodisca vitripennis]
MESLSSCLRVVEPFGYCLAFGVLNIRARAIWRTISRAVCEEVKGFGLHPEVIRGCNMGEFKGQHNREGDH